MILIKIYLTVIIIALLNATIVSIIYTYKIDNLDLWYKRVLISWFIILFLIIIGMLLSIWIF